MKQLSTISVIFKPCAFVNKISILIQFVIIFINMRMSFFNLYASYINSQFLLYYYFNIIVLLHFPHDLWYK